MNEELKNALEALKTALENSEELKNYRAAKREYDSDTALTALVSEYNIQATLLEQEGRKPDGEKDEALVDSIARRLRNIYDELQENEHLAAMRAAEDALTPLVNAVNDAVRFTINPESAYCTHDCSTCGGCH